MSYNTIQQAINAQIRMQNVQVRIADALAKEGIKFSTVFDEFIIEAKNKAEAERADEIIKTIFNEETK